MTKNNIKPDINFEQDLWKAANELRGAVAENQYKDYVLSLLFLKYMSEKFEKRKTEIEGLIEDPESEYHTTDPEEKEYWIADEDEYKKVGILVLPEECTWEHLQSNAEQDDIKIKVDKAFTILDEKLAEYKPTLKGLLPPLFVKSQLTATQTGGLINLFSHKKFSLIENPESDIFGRIYEYYIGKFAMAEGSGAGQFFTPGSIVRLPDKLFMTTGIPAALFFLSKNRDGNDGKRARMDEILFIDASKLGEMTTRRLRVFSEEDIGKIADAYHQWRNTDGKYENIPGFCKAAKLEEVKQNDYKLTPGIYVGSEAEEDDGIPFEEKMGGLKGQLKEQFEKSNILQEQIMKNLDSL